MCKNGAQKSHKQGFRPFSLLSWLGSGVGLIELRLHIDVELIVTHHDCLLM